MPFYEYECSACKFYVEALQKISDAQLKECPSCGKATLQRLISAPVFRLKGSGWYETDFKSDQENKRNLADDKEQPVVAESGDEKAKVRVGKVAKKSRGAAAVKKASGKTAKQSASVKVIAKAKLKPKTKASAAAPKPKAKTAVVKKRAAARPVRKAVKKHAVATKKAARKK